MILKLNYYYLVNFYAKPYAKATADTDLGVTIKTTEYIEDIYFTRNTVAEVYKQILEDLASAKRLLQGKKKKTVYRACRTGFFKPYLSLHGRV